MNLAVKNSDRKRSRLSQSKSPFSKTMALRILTAGLVVGILFLVSSPSLAARKVKVPPIEIHKTGNFVGQYLILYYAFGQPPIVSTYRGEILLTAVKAAAIKKIERDSVSFPSVEIDKENVRGAYNTVVAVITPYDKYVWKNADGSIPTPLVDTKIYQDNLRDYKTLADINKHITLSNDSTTFVWPLF